MASQSVPETLFPTLYKKPPFTVDAVGAQKVDGETVPRRNVTAAHGLHSTLANGAITTVYENLRFSVKKFRNRHILGSRDILNVHEENKKVPKVVDGKETLVDKKWTYFELSPYKFTTYAEFDVIVHQIGAGLRALGLDRTSKVHLYGSTSAHWIQLALGATSQSIPFVTAYDSLGPDGLSFSIRQTGTSAIYIDPGLLPALTSVLDSTPSIKSVIYNTRMPLNQAHADALKAKRPDINVLSFEELRHLGTEHPVDPVAPTPDDTACVMYTSGSTGAPKGVLLTHRNVTAGMAGADSCVAHVLTPDDVFLAYLPQAHILEFVVENLCILWGACLGYGSPRTLTDVSVRNCKGDIGELRPTIMIGVPAVWETVQKGIVANVSKGSLLVQTLFWGALRAKRFLLAHGLPGVSLLDAVVFSKARAATGGRMRFALNGGGPISNQTQEFLSMVLCPMIGGYGLTETSAMGALNDPLAWNPRSIGEVPASIEIKLVDFADAGYFSTNSPPQGEIWIRGDAVTSGYYDNEEETSAAITPDGWFKTGDIGEFDHLGHLRIIDRKKNLVKTLNGEYIALEKLESAYRSAPIVANICVYAAQDQARPIAIVVPNDKELIRLARQQGITESTVEKLIHQSSLRRAVLDELIAFGKRGKLSGIELVVGVVLSDEEWTPQSGFVTAAQKLQRKKIVTHFAKEVDQAYGKK